MKAQSHTPMRRALSLFLVVVMLASMVVLPSQAATFEFKLNSGETVQQMMDRINAATPAYRAGYLTNGQPINDANIQAMLAEFEKTMPEGTAWSTGEKYYYRSSKMGYGGGCNSFAYAISDTIFGEDCPVTQHQNYDDIKTGDVIWLKSTPTGGGHVIVATSNPDELGYFDVCDGNNDSKVSWTSYDNVNYIKDNTEYNQYSTVYSRY